ncbi:efflux RND transporter permease subunit [Membranihabitans maritimus]|uniref:efflux RND transporter permease subunit n=1 Tax=Membranihabitans maritimus TaxID=2904244 RepID=UPI001F024956|nr:efflux RND transporter permease subunit [Membranihabitans maritimus]
MKDSNTFRFSPFRILLLSIVVAGCGLAVIPFLSIQLNPPPRTQNLSVSFTLGGVTPEVIESDITAPLERIFASLEGLESIESRSSEGRGTINLHFSDEYEIEQKRLEVSAKIRQIYSSLPMGTSYPGISYRSDFQKDQQLLSMAVNSSLPAHELHDFLSKNLLPLIAAGEGITSVDIYGAPQRELHLLLDRDKMQYLQIRPEDISTAIRGSIRKDEIGRVIRNAGGSDSDLVYLVNTGSGIYRQPSAFIPDIPVKRISGRTIYIRDVGQLAERQAPKSQFYRINGLQSINLSIAVDRSANLIQKSDEVLKVMDRFEQEYGAFVDIFVSYNASDFLKRELKKITNRSLATLAILLVFIILLYRNIRQILIIFSGLVVTLLISFLCYYLLGVSLHLYSVAGLTISLGIILDNILVMSDHVRKKANRDIFLAILAATLTTIGALAAIFLMEKGQRENLVDFFRIFSINLLVSLGTSLILIPALHKRFGGRTKGRKRLNKGTRIFNNFYAGYFTLFTRRRWIIPLVLLVGFGIPFFMLPTKIEKDTSWAKHYNEIQEKEMYSEYIRPFMDKWLGGTFRLFYNHRDRFYFGSGKREETKVFLHAQMPPGGTLEQLNEVMLRIESYLKTFPEIRQFKMNASGPQNGRIEIVFKEPYDKTGFPFQLKDELTTFAVSAGSADFRVWGVGDAFNNVLPGDRVSSHIILTGYNYDKIWDLARRGKGYLEQHPRIKKVFINSDMNYVIPNKFYFYMDIVDPGRLLKDDIRYGDFSEFFQSIQRDHGRIARWPNGVDMVPVRLVSSLEDEDQMWSLLNSPVPGDSASIFRNKSLLTLSKEQGSTDIVRKNQEYQLVLEYDFIGNYRLAEKVMEESIDQIQNQLPIGYNVESQRNFWSRGGDKTNIIWIIVAGLFFVWILGSILFNSLRQALIPVAMVPFSYIGIFLITHFVDFRFGQGGLASFLLVGGLSVNAVFFIINDYNRLRSIRPQISTLQAYIKAYNGKIIPILLTALSTVLGLLPFIVFDKNDPFWYSLAWCTIGGVVASVAVLFFMLPVFFKLK